MLHVIDILFRSHIMETDFSFKHYINFQNSTKWQNVSYYRKLRRELRNISNGVGDDSKLPLSLRSQKCPSGGASNSNGELDEYHNFTEQNGINDTFLPPMVRAALLENSKPEKCSMKSEASQDSVDKQAYQLGKYFLIYHSFRLTNNSIIFKIYSCIFISKHFNIFLFQING